MKLVISGVPSCCEGMSSTQVSFRSRVVIEHKQLEPLVRAIQMPRVYLLVVCEDGLIVPRRARRQVQDWVSF